MTDKGKKVLKVVGVVAVAAGTVAVYVGGGSEGYVTEIIGSVFIAIGMITKLVQK